MKYWLTLGLWFLLSTGLQADDGWHSPHSAHLLVGETATICGVVGSARHVESSRGSPTYINLGRAYPDHVFTIVIWGTDRQKFHYAPDQLQGAICVRGEVELYRGVPQIVVRSPDQISR